MLRVPTIKTPKHTEKKRRPAQPSQKSKPSKKNVMALIMTGVEALQELEGGMSDGEAITLIRYGIADALPQILSKVANVSPDEAKTAIEVAVEAAETEAAKKS